MSDDIRSALREVCELAARLTSDMARAAHDRRDAVNEHAALTVHRRVKRLALLAETSGTGEGLTVRPDPNAPKVGERVRRGPDWKWGDQDGHPGNTGTVVEICDDGWAEVRWDGTVYMNGYRTPRCYAPARDLTVVSDAPCSLVEAE